MDILVKYEQQNIMAYYILFEIYKVISLRA